MLTYHFLDFEIPSFVDESPGNHFNFELLQEPLKEPGLGPPEPFTASLNKNLSTVVMDLAMEAGLPELTKP